MGTKLVGDHLSRGTKFLGTICPWGQNWLETVCPEGPINWGPIVGDQMSGDHMCLGQNVSQPIIYCVFFFWIYIDKKKKMTNEQRYASCYACCCGGPDCRPVDWLCFTCFWGWLLVKLIIKNQ